jgi:hypothetical protein
MLITKEPGAARQLFAMIFCCWCSLGVAPAAELIQRPASEGGSITLEQWVPDMEARAKVVYDDFMASLIYPLKQPEFDKSMARNEAMNFVLSHAGQELAGHATTPQITALVGEVRAYVNRLGVTPVAPAADARCNAPPYGGTADSYKAFVENFGHIVVPTDYLQKICNAKYGGVARTGLYNLGFTDAEIDSKDTEDLAVDAILALKSLVDKVK